jgi:starch phosphorylase
MRLRHAPESFLLQPEGARDANGEQRYALALAPELCGKLEYRIRAYPSHPTLAHRFQMGLMKWL